jgi:tetratricopeptide (TPR) repeat protein
MMEVNMMDDSVKTVYETEIPTNSGDQEYTKFQDISKYILLILTFLLPIFFIPNTIFPFQFGKILVVSLGTILAFIFWVIHQLKVGKLTLPRPLILPITASILLIGLVSAFLSGSFMESVFGSGSEMDTLFFTLMLFMLLFTASQVFNSSRSVLGFYLTLFASFAVLVLYQTLRVFVGVDFLDFGILNNSTSNLLGRWNDLGVIFGFSALVSVVALEFFTPTKLMKILLYISIFLSLAFTVIVNSFIVWIVLGILSLALFVYLFFKRNSKNVLTENIPKRKKKISVLSIAVLVLSIIFIFVRPQVGELISERFDISQIEARPSLTSTIGVAKATLNKNPGFGVGPNRFAIEWGLNKPLQVNNTIFWNVNFNYGIGVIPTSIITYGILGFLAWVIFLGLLIFLGIRALFSDIEDSISRFVIVSSFIGTLYLWIFAIVSVPGIVVITITFLTTGIFLASLSYEGLLKTRTISFSDDSKIGFASVFILITFLIGNLGLGYAITGRYISFVHTQKALAAVNLDRNLDSALNSMDKALSLAKTDNNYRFMSQVHIARLRDLLNEDLSGSEESLIKFQEILGFAILNAQTATEIDSEDYRNWMALGNIYEAVISLGIEGSYESAREAYEKAKEVNPTNPSVDLALARIEVLNGNNEVARVHIFASLQKKNNYLDPIYLLSQIEINEGNIIEATRAVEAASIINPNDITTFFQLGFLKFSLRDFEGAILALERSISLSPPYSNAKYFLGLSYYSVGRVEDAIVQFEDIEELNPDNEEVKTILDNLRNGQAPFLNIIKPDTGTIEELPVQES